MTDADTPRPPSEPTPASTAPASDAAKDWANRAEAAGYPPDHGPERRVLVTHPALFRARPLSFMGLLIAMVASGAGIGYGLWGLEGTWGSILMAASSTLLAVLLLVLVIWKVKQVARTFEITNKRSVQSFGLFSKSSSEVLHDNIRSVRIDQTFWERIWNIGTIELSSSAEDLEVRMEKLKDPEELRKIIDLYRPM